MNLPPQSAFLLAMRFLAVALLLLPATPAFAKDGPKAIHFDIDELAAREAAGPLPSPSERLTRITAPQPASRRFTASMDLGRTRLFAFSAKLAPRERDAFADIVGLAATPLPDRARIVGGKSVGAGASRRIGRFEVESRAAFARASADGRDPTSDGMAGKAHSASLTAAARLRF